MSKKANKGKRPSNNNNGDDDNNNDNNSQEVVQPKPPKAPKSTKADASKGNAPTTKKSAAKAKKGLQGSDVGLNQFSFVLFCSPHCSTQDLPSQTMSFMVRIAIPLCVASNLFQKHFPGLLAKYKLPGAPTTLSFNQVVPAITNTRQAAAQDGVEFCNLLESIKAFGLLSTFPIVVTPRLDGKFDLVDGHHQEKAVRSLRAEDPQRWLDVEFHVVVVQRDTPADVIKMLSIMQNAASASNITAKLSDVTARCAEVVFLFFFVVFF